MPIFNSFFKKRNSPIETVSLVEKYPKIHKFLNRNQDVNLIDLVEEYSHYAQYSGVWNSDSDVSLSREIPQMLRDPIIQSCLATIMENAFQPDTFQRILWVNSSYPVIKKTLEDFHDSLNFDTFVLTMAYNLLLWGNLPYRHVFDNEGKLKYVLPVPNYTSITPIIYANQCLGYLENGEYHYPYEYSYSQLQYYKNLGGPSYSNITAVAGQEGSFVNEFALAPSYLTTAVTPWKNIRIIEDALLLNRMDQSNYYRLLMVNVGDKVDSKPAIRLLNFYRDLFKKVRRISYDSNGMASKGTNQEFEVILPQTDRQKLEVKDVGGQVEVKAIEDMDKQLDKLFAALRVQPWMIGYSSDVPTGDNYSSAYLMDARFAKLCKTLIFSVTNTLYEIDKIYLESHGFNVKKDMWSYGTVSSTILEDKSKAEALDVAAKNLKTLTEQFNQMQLAYNKSYLVESILGTALSSTSVDLTRLLEVQPEVVKANALESNAFRVKTIERTLTVISSSALSGSTVGKEISNFLGSSSEETSAPHLELQSSQGTISLEQALSDEIPLADSTLIDLKSFATLSNKTSNELVDDWNTLLSSKQVEIQSLAFLPIYFPVVIPSDTQITLGDLRNASLGPIESLVLTQGGYLFQKKSDLVTYLFHKKSCLSSVVVQNTIKIPVQN